ncbi:bifunctional (p)ppGpp synthetase/guanosine-3',5'-bis(diphosphate) 3'-pyrophosphohydrolase [Candidatus Nomurabacteria bacterium]|nr:bifunctional (p)ppGpp synthetase/guanosine-3',5'-bis(diphosphate) 3'-pyrophosphohydrolase [Candidatus Nomurabacteria bacterium]
MATLKEIIDLMESPKKEDIELITSAYEFSENAHKDQKRYSGEPYFVHVSETAKILAEIKMCPKTIAAGLLHDTLEDAGITEKELEEKFGKEILFLVKGVTKIGKLRYRGAERHIESLKKLFVAISQDIRVIIIKLADRLHNMRTLQYVPKHKQFRIASETLKIYAPIAYRLGINRLNRELEDLSFCYVSPKECEEIRKLVKEKTKDIAVRLEKFNKSLKKACAKEGMTDIKTSFRIKNLYSTYRKWLRKEKDVDKIYDIYAIRVYVKNIADCYKVLGIIHGVWRPLPGRIKDYIAVPKTNGYRSIHTTVFSGDGGIVEVQIRTEEMHRQAEYGIASHMSYRLKTEGKKNDAMAWFKNLLPENDKETFNSLGEISKGSVPDWIKQLADSQTSAKDGEEFMENLHTDFFENRVFLFTPKGDVVDLPIDSSPVDFAYAIHSDIGNHMFGAKVNNKLVSLDTQLKNGDIVEILTKKNAKPSTKWIDFAKTTMAKRHIKLSLQKNS